MKTPAPQKCDHCEAPAVAIDYVDGFAHAWCESCKAPRRTERYIREGKLFEAHYAPERAEVAGVVRVIGWSLIAEAHGLRGRGKTQPEALAEFKVELDRQQGLNPIRRL